MNGHTHADHPEAQGALPDRTHPTRDSCYAKRPEVGGTSYTWEAHNGSQAVYRGGGHRHLRSDAARQGQMARATAPGIATLPRRRYLSLKGSLEVLGDL